MNDRFSSPNRLFFVLCAALLPLLSFAQATLAPLPPIDSLSDWQVSELVQQYAAKALVFEQILSERTSAATTRRVNKEELLQMVTLDSTFSKSDQDSIANLLKIFKKEEKAAVQKQKQAANTLKLANNIMEFDNDAKRKKLPVLWKEMYKTDLLINPPEKEFLVKKAPKKPVIPKKSSKEKNVKPAEIPEEGRDIVVEAAIPISLPSPPKNQQTAVPTRKYDPAADVMLHPPSLPCRLSVDTRDEFSGEQYRRTVSVELFRSSPAALKAFLQGKPNVQCDAALISSGANAFLDLTFTINDPNPRKSFGKIEKGSLTTLKFMDGSSYNLSNQQLSDIVQNQETQVAVCSAQYLLPAEALKKIRRSELDKIRIAWSSGYEDYDVQYVVLLMEQANCLFGL